jgi:hypothetical protein
MSNVTPTTGTWISRIYEIARTTLWAVVAAWAAIMIMNIPRIVEARATLERQRVQEIFEENRLYCEKWGMRAGTHEHTLCTLDLQEIRGKIEQHIADDMAY